MKKNIISAIVLCVISFVAGLAFGWNGCTSKNRTVYNLSILKGQLADTIMSRNNVYDMDGGDQMAEYLEVSARLDTLLAK